MGIYYIHMMVIWLVGDVRIFFISMTSNKGSSTSMVLGAALYFFVAYCICLVMSRIKFLKLLV